MKLPFGQERSSLHFSSSLDTMDASNRVTTRVDRGQRGHRKQGSKDLKHPLRRKALEEFLRLSFRQKCCLPSLAVVDVVMLI
ncbi:hypothetical protein CDAR_96361 [Caerostris darwini]|uniref:Uncharacterized protein n=1 Tax=Caerostris darwini TaxID=1538125 RepID=A0AAV4TDH1_9ARAC|nr:hypothetical protein CDAR_96361 [Caerostris darwini]